MGASCGCLGIPEEDLQLRVKVAMGIDPFQSREPNREGGEPTFDGLQRQMSTKVGHVQPCPVYESPYTGIAIMATRRKTIPLKPHEDRQLKRQYLLGGIRWISTPNACASGPHLLSNGIANHTALTAAMIFAITRLQNERMASGCDSMVTTNAFGIPKKVDISEQDWNAAVAVYEPMDIGRDQLGFNNELRLQLAAGFTALTGRYVTGDLLYAFAMAMQKHRGNGWPRLNGKSGWGDAEAVA